MKYLLLASAILLSACGSLTKQKDEAQLGKVKKVALVGFKANLPEPSGIGLNLNSGKVSGMQGGSMISEKSPQTDNMFMELHASLGKRTNWNILEVRKMKENPAYVAAYEKTMKGWQNKVPPGAGTKNYLVDGIMDNDGPRILDVAGREQLIKDLGVDAIALVNIHVVLDGTTVMGIGSRKPKSQVHMQIFAKGIAAPVWFETFDGETSAESVGATGIYNEDKMRELALKSTATAYTKIAL